MDAADPPKCPVDECTLPIDICLRSSDGVLIGAHTRNLEIFSDAFPSTSLSTLPSEPVALTETAVVLQLLMHFMHNVRQPSLEEKPFDLVLGFAEAVEKYGVHAADQLCWLKMRDHIPNYALGVLNFGVRHNLEDLVKLAAPETIRYSFSAVVQAFSSEPVLLARWIEELVLSTPTARSLHVYILHTKEEVTRIAVRLSLANKIHYRSRLIQK
ncbi:hypothetical protein K523DRAFT_257541 [Schizophyllum commune Tattone D]|nr:hypothetical protein K525DRAFT_206351 [Schizophyllum commune Loenen D]KAI5822078.1 hypothetical protein K523DRAFT_257541 [Schizophyllum commune Tattone D]